MWFGILGPLVISHGSAVIEIPNGRQKQVLAALLVRPNHIVTADALIDSLWDEPPPSARVTLRNHVRRLRQALGPAGSRIATRPPGYLIEVADEESDLLTFVRLCHLGQAKARSGDWRESARVLDEALALWRGDLMADVPAQPQLEAENARLDEMRLQALESSYDARLCLGESSDLIADLRRLVAQYPLRERLQASLMLALYRAGRQGEALSSYQETRRKLVDELGVSPGTELQRLHARILRTDPALLTADPRAEASGRTAATPASPAPTPSPTLTTSAALTTSITLTTSTGIVPRQLPAAPRSFVGRETQLKTLWNALPDPASPKPGDTSVICAIDGTAGIGKTSLALHWAHQAAPRFPDGQVYVNLRGFDPAGRPTSPTEAVRGFLDAFGVPAVRVPAGVDAQTALYRSLLADKRVLVVLDNAGDVEQVRPLLPGGPHCLVLVTSRSQLAGLAAAEGALWLSLDVLSEPESAQVLQTRLAPDRACAEAEAAAELLRLCAGLPLALCIVSARAAIHPRLSLAALARELGESRGRLDALDIGDASTDMRAAISWSYRGLSPHAARVFRLLALHPGPDISESAAACLAGEPRTATHVALTELVRANLLAEQIPGRYSLHDLLRAYAAEQASETDSAAERAAAVRRVLDHYLATTDLATALIEPTRDFAADFEGSDGSLGSESGGAGVGITDLTDAAEALEWFELEHRVLLGAITQALAEGFLAHAWQIACLMTVFFDRRGHWHDWIVAQRHGLEAARLLDEPTAQARIHRSLGNAHAARGDHDEAKLHHLASIELCGRVGDRIGEAHGHRGVSLVCESLGLADEELDHARRALRLYTEAGHRLGQAHALNDLGWILGRNGDFDVEVEYCGKAQRLMRELGDLDGEAAALDSLGYAYRKLGRRDLAIDHYRRALAGYQQLGDRYRQARTLIVLAAVQLEAGERDAARRSRRQAADLLTELALPDTDHLRERLRELAD
jgi:DNA-binding SARP family transcriptional activator